MCAKKPSDDNNISLVKRDIYISSWGLADSNTITELKAPDPNNVLILYPTFKPIHMRLNDELIELKSNELLVTTQKEFSLLGRTKVLYLHIGGTLAQKYITLEKRNKVLSFSAADEIILIIHFLTEALSKGMPIPQKKKIKMAFSIAVDIFLYTDQQTVYPLLVQDALHIINNEYCFICGIDDLADKLGVTKSHLIRVFRSSLGITPGTYLERIRMEKAKIYLQSRSLNIESIAHLTGYSCANYFAKVFKKNTGLSPTDFVRSSPNKDIDITHEIPDDFYV